MKFKVLLPLSLVLLVVSLNPFSGCARTPAAMAPDLPHQVIWSNGSIGTWFSNSLTPYCGGCNTTESTVVVTDPISGDSNTMRLTTSTTGGFYYFQAPVTVDPSIYYGGHLEFDMRLEQTPSDITSMNIEYINYAGSGNSPEYIFPTSQIDSLSTSSFTHISIPFSSFTGNTSYNYIQKSIDTPFQISWSASISGTALTIDNILWSAN